MQTLHTKTGETRIRAQELAESGLNQSEIARQLNVSRERVRQVLMSIPSGWKRASRICQYCNNTFVPKHKFQSTCCNRSIPPKPCSFCGEMVSVNRSYLKKYELIACDKPICTNQWHEARLSSHPRIVWVNTKCTLCGSDTEKPEYVVKRKSKIRCERCIARQFTDRCRACGKLITRSIHQLCKQHIGYKSQVSVSSSKM